MSLPKSTTVYKVATWSFVSLAVVAAAVGYGFKMGRDYQAKHTNQVHVEAKNMVTTLKSTAR